MVCAVSLAVRIRLFPERSVSRPWLGVFTLVTGLLLFAPISAWALPTCNIAFSVNANTSNNLYIFNSTDLANCDPGFSGISPGVQTPSLGGFYVPSPNNGATYTTQSTASDDRINYTPAANFTGIQTFGVCGEPGTTNCGTVTVTVLAIPSTATTGSASGISATGATLNGTVNDNGATTTVTFDYGLNTGYGTNVGATTGGTVTAGSGATAVSRALTGLTCHTTYHFRVKGLNSAGTTNGGDASFTTSLCPQTITFNNPGTQNYGTAPTLSASSDSSLTVTFTSSTTGVCTITAGGALTFLSVGTCTINADQAGNSTYAAATQVSQSFTVAAVVPGVPTSVAGTGGNAQVSLSWTAPASTGGAAIAGYSVTQSTDSMSYTAVSAGTCASSAPTSNSTSCTVTGLTNGTAYTFKVAAINSAGTGTASTASSSVTPATTADAPTGVAGSSGNTQVSLSWVAPTMDGGSGIIGYAVTQSTDGMSYTAVAAGSCASLAPTSTSTTCTVTGLTNGSAYTFKVATINGVGTGAASTASSSVTPATTADPPLGVSGLIGNTQVILSWTAPSSNGGSTITGYALTQSTDGMSYSSVSAGTCASAAPTSTSTTCSVTGLSNATAYTFKVATINGAGTGSDSVPSPSITPAPQNLTVTITHVGTVMLGTAGGAYTLTVTNTGGFTDGSTVTVTDTLPTGLTATSVNGMGWTCDSATDPTAPFCTRADVLLNGASYPDIVLIADVDNSAPDPITDEATNSANVAGGGDGTPAVGNDTAVVHVYTNSFEDP